jgi:hypothetical protein
MVIMKLSLVMVLSAALALSAYGQSVDWIAQHTGNSLALTKKCLAAGFVYDPATQSLLFTPHGHPHPSSGYYHSVNPQGAGISGTYGDEAGYQRLRAADMAAQRQARGAREFSEDFHSPNRKPVYDHNGNQVGWRIFSRQAGQYSNVDGAGNLLPPWQQ